MRRWLKLMALVALGVSVRAQSGAAAAKHPDLSGSWRAERDGFGPDNVGFPIPTPYLPEAAAKAKLLKGADDPGARCIPYGVTRQTMGAQLAWLDIAQSPTKIYILYFQRYSEQVIYMDGRKHPKTLAPASYYGHSIGHWEGDTLVADIVLENPRTWFETPAGDRPVLIHSAALHLTERFRVLEGGKILEIRTTIEDPKTYTQPIQLVHRFRSVNGQEQTEYICEEGIQLEGDL